MFNIDDSYFCNDLQNSLRLGLFMQFFVTRATTTDEITIVAISSVSNDLTFFDLPRQHLKEY